MNTFAFTVCVLFGRWFRNGGFGALKSLFTWGRPAMAACGVRLVLGPALAHAVIPLVGLSGIQASTGILQSAMPAAILTAFVAMEHDIVPTFVTTVVFASTLVKSGQSGNRAEPFMT